MLMQPGLAAPMTAAFGNEAIFVETLLNTTETPVFGRWLWPYTLAADTFPPSYKDKRRKYVQYSAHSKESVTIERVFGQIKIRFPILAHVSRIKLDTVPKVVVACAFLHNIGKYINDVFEIDD